MGDFIVAIALVVVSLFLFILSIRSFLEKGFLFNNAYIFASQKERETMNKKPYYRQTAIVFFLMGITFLLIGFEILFDAGWITYIAGVVIIIILIYAITSSIAIEKKARSRDNMPSNSNLSNRIGTLLLGSFSPNSAPFR